MNSTYYQHSGKAPILGILMTLIGGLVGGGLLGAIYGFLIYWCPLVYINFFITAGFGFAIGMLVGGLAKLGKIRSFGSVTIMVLAVTAVAYYIHWAVWVGRMVETQTFEASQLWALMSMVATLGPWSIFGFTPSGAVLWAIWAVEAIIIFAVAIIAARSIIDSPFCEKTGQWAEEEDLPARFAGFDGAAPSNPQTLVAALKPLSDDSASHNQVSIATVAGSSLRCVSIKAVQVTVKDGDEDTEEETIVSNMLFDQTNFDKLLTMAKRPA